MTDSPALLTRDIVLELRHSDRDFQSNKKQLHSLAQLSHADVKPPEGAVVYELQRVLIKLSVRSLTDARKKERPKRQISVPRDDMKQSLSEADEMIVHKAVPHLQRHNANVTEHGHAVSSNQDPCADGDDFSPDGTDSAFTGLDMCRPLQETIVRTRDPHLERTPPSNIPDSSDKSNTLRPETLCEVLDAALRYVITSHPANLTDFKLKKSKLSPRLSELAPVLFSPGYAASVAQQTALIPTVSHALSNYIYQRQSYHDKDDMSPRDLKRKTEAGLFQLLKRQAFQTKTAKRLKPITLHHHRTCLSDDLLIECTEGLDEASPVIGTSEWIEDDHPTAQ